MNVGNRQDFLACLDQHDDRNGLEVFAHAKRHLLVAVDEVGFDDFGGHDYEVVGRLAETLHERDNDAALWGRVFIDLWYCSNFGGRHWSELVARDPANITYAIQAAHWVFAVSGANGGPALAAVLNQRRCWDVAEQYMSQHAERWLREWWAASVVPLRERGITCRPT
jgi:hypothetical protein